MNGKDAGVGRDLGSADDAANDDTIGLLQTEIARLEAELRARDETWLSAFEAPPPPSCQDESLRRRVEELVAELAAREETITLLLDQTRLFEEAVGAQQAEWEQLNRWVGEVERRVHEKDSRDAVLGAELEAERTAAVSLRRQADADRRAWEADRKGLEREAEQLRAALTRTAGRDGAATELEALLASLRDENRRLHEACADRDRAVENVEDLTRRLVAADTEGARLHDDLRLAHDDLQRERNEHEAALAELRGRLARESLGKSPEPAPGLDPDERIRAFRQHLQHIHEREASERARRGLAARLSRLWHQTGPVS